MRIVSYNIHGCVGTDGRRDPGRIAAVLAALEPDLVLLQEVDSRLSRGGLDQAMLLGRALGMAVVEGPLLREHRGHYGNAVLSRWPVRHRAEGPYRAQGFEPRGWLLVEAVPPGGWSWRALVTHLDLCGRARTAQLAELAALVAAQTAPFLLAGDLNEWRPWRRRLAGLPRALDLLEPQPTFPARLPVLALDRIGVKGAAVRVKARVDRSPLARKASDHLPLWAELDAGTSP